MISPLFDQSFVALDEQRHPRPERLALVTDFGSGPYVGQLHLLAAALAPGLPVINLINDVPAFCPDLAAHLLPGLIRGMPSGTLYLCVVDPGVGGARAALALCCGQNWFVGPDNGLLAPLVRQYQALDSALWRIDWRPPQSSDSFHGRDLFLPIALAISHGQLPLPCQSLEPNSLQGKDGTLGAERILYIDHYGNLMTGLALSGAGMKESLPNRHIRVGQLTLPYARTFCEVAVGAAFWYENAFGLVEIAANQRRADALLGLSVGDPVRWEPGEG